MARYAKSDLTTIVGLSGRAIAVACLTGILVGVVGAEASAQVPTPDRPLLCQLSQETADLLASEIEEQFTASGSTNGIGSVADPAVVDVVVIYRLDRSNWGQPIVDNKNPPLTVGTTARVICATEGITKNFADEDDRFPSCPGPPSSPGCAGPGPSWWRSADRSQRSTGRSTGTRTEAPRSR